MAKSAELIAFIGWSYDDREIFGTQPTCIDKCFVTHYLDVYRCIYEYYMHTWTG